MKKVLLTAALVMVATSAFAVSDITNSKHNLASGGGQSITGTSGELCKYCHTPHNAGAVAPLWNRTNGSNATSYDSTSMVATAAVPAGTSLMCLSCHTGTTVSQALASLDVQGLTGNKAISGDGMANDHPVSIDYLGNTAGLNAAVTTTKLFSGKVECASCHAVHDNTVPPFLRTTNAGSALCLDCHAK